jgi:hypothetical protein
MSKTHQNEILDYQLQEIFIIKKKFATFIRKLCLLITKAQIKKKIHIYIIKIYYLVTWRLNALYYSNYIFSTERKVYIILAFDSMA